MTTPPSTDFYGCIEINSASYKEHEPKLPTDEVFVNGRWKLSDKSKHFQGPIYRRRIAIPEFLEINGEKVFGWELVPLDEQIDSELHYTEDGIVWKYSFYCHDGSKVKYIIAANPHIKSIIRRKEPMVGGTELKLPEILSGKQEFDTAKFLAEKDAFAKTPEGQEITRRAKASAERLMKIMEQLKQEAVCECGHSIKEHKVVSFQRDPQVYIFCVPGCPCNEMKPKSKGGQNVSIEEINEVQSQCNSLGVQLQPAPETASAEKLLAPSIIFCKNCESALSLIYNVESQNYLVEPCQRCLDAAKGEWVFLDDEWPTDRDLRYEVQWADGARGHNFDCETVKAMIPSKGARWFKPAAIPDPPPVNGMERDDALLDGFMSDFLKYHSWPMRPDLRSLIRETAAAAIAYERSRAK